MNLRRCAAGTRPVRRTGCPPSAGASSSSARCARCAATCSASPQRTTTLAGSEEVLIIPHTIARPFPSVGAAGRLGEHLRMQSWGQSGSEFHSLREYMRGDDLRRISWKASARCHIILIVRETALEGMRRCTVVLDTTASEYTGSSFEQAVIAAASITASAAHTGVNTRFVTNDIDLRGHDVAANALRWLAMVEPATEPPEMISVNNGMSEGMGLLVIVTGSASSAAAGQLRSTANQDETLVIVCAREYAPSSRFIVDATSTETMVASWTALIVGASQPVLS